MSETKNKRNLSIEKARTKRKNYLKNIFENELALGFANYFGTKWQAKKRRRVKKCKTIFIETTSTKTMNLLYEYA